MPRWSAAAIITPNAINEANEKDWEGINVFVWANSGVVQLDGTDESELLEPPTLSRRLGCETPPRRRTSIDAIAGAVNRVRG